MSSYRSIKRKESAFDASHSAYTKKSLKNAEMNFPRRRGVKGIKKRRKGKWRWRESNKKECLLYFRDNERGRMSFASDELERERERERGRERMFTACSGIRNSMRCCKLHAAMRWKNIFLDISHSAGITIIHCNGRRSCIM